MFETLNTVRGYGLVAKSLSHLETLVTPWAPLSMGFSRQEYWSGLPFLSLEDLPDPRIEPWAPALQGDCLPSESPGKPTSIFIKPLCPIRNY